MQLVEPAAAPAVRPPAKLHTIVLATAPRRILIGGGVPEGRPELLQRVRVQLLQSLNGYLKLDKLLGGIDSYAVPPGLGPRSGPLGALALAADKVS
jgi:fructokinase